MKIIYSHENKILVENARNLLAHNGIEAILKNEYASGGIGELSAIDTWPELWLVNDDDYGNAKLLLGQLSTDIDQDSWKCTSCQELNEPSFDFCWNCQIEKP